MPTDHRVGPALIAALLISLTAGCGDDSTGPEEEPGDTFRQAMRDFVQHISAHARADHPAFVVIPQNGNELLTANGEDDGDLVGDYANAISGMGREDLFYGYDEDDVATPPGERDWMLAFLDLAEANGIEVLVTDYCETVAFMEDSYQQSAQRSYISLAADRRELDHIPAYPPQPFNANSADVTALSAAQNFLYVLDPSAFADRTVYLDVLRATQYDLLIIDAFCDESELTPAEVASLKTKEDGAARLVVAYMSIGEAEDYRYYWEESWDADPPAWLAGENPDWEGNYKVRYWDPAWQAIIYGGATSYLDRILAAGFDGVYLDIIDAFEYFEE